MSTKNKKEQVSVRAIGDTMKSSNICVIGVPEEEREDR